MSGFVGGCCGWEGWEFALFFRRPGEVGGRVEEGRGVKNVKDCFHGRKFEAEERCKW